MWGFFWFVGGYSGARMWRGQREKGSFGEVARRLQKSHITLEETDVSSQQMHVKNHWRKIDTSVGAN